MIKSKWDSKNEIVINDFKYFFVHRGRRYIDLELYLNNNKLLNFYKHFMEITYFKQYFSQGRFFLFILLDETHGLKILRPSRKVGSYKRVEKIIKIQKIFYENGVSFDCEDDVLEIPIKDIASDTQCVCNGYITTTDINFSKLKHQLTDLDDVSSRLLSICKDNNISRFRLYSELSRGANYTLTNNNEYKLIDIDPRFYFLE